MLNVEKKSQTVKIPEARNATVYQAPAETDTRSFENVNLSAKSAGYLNADRAEQRLRNDYTASVNYSPLAFCTRPSLTGAKLGVFAQGKFESAVGGREILLY